MYTYMLKLFSYLLDLLSTYLLDISYIKLYI
jgi:hypothetical protein